MPKPRSKEENRIYSLERYHKLRKAAIQKLGGICVGCGTTDGLEFHHKDPTIKSFGVGEFWSISKAKLTAELEKCELRCSKHHKEFHASKHGTVGCYRHQKCRCDLCLAANRKYMQAYMQEHRRRT